MHPEDSRWGSAKGFFPRCVLHSLEVLSRRCTQWLQPPARFIFFLASLLIKSRPLPLAEEQRRPQSGQIRGDFTIRMRNSWGAAEVMILTVGVADLCSCPPVLFYLPVLAVLQPVADLVFGLEQEVLESRRGLPANAQLVFQLPDAADCHSCGRVRGHWRTQRGQNKECLNR